MALHRTQLKENIDTEHNGKLNFYRDRPFESSGSAVAVVYYNSVWENLSNFFYTST